MLNQRREDEVISCYKGEQNYLAFFISKVNLIWSSHNDQITLYLAELYQLFGQGKALSYALHLAGLTALHNICMVCIER